MSIRNALAWLLLLAAIAPVPARAADVYLYENFDDGDYDPGVLLFGDAFQNTVGTGTASAEWSVQPDAAGFHLESLLEVASPASDESDGSGSQAWAAKVAEVPALAAVGFTLSVDVDVVTASADGADRSLSVGIAARCRSFFGAPNCITFSGANRYYRLSYALAGAGDFADPGAPAATGQLRLVEVQGDGQVDAAVDASAVAAGGPFSLLLQGTPLEGGGLHLVGRMRNAVAEASVEAVDPTPLDGPGFGIRIGGSVRGSGGADSLGVLHADFDDLLLLPEPGAMLAASCACLALAALRGARS